MLKATIVYIIDPDTQEVLMARKVRKVGIGYWFGYGGKIEEGQTPEECMFEETFKESGNVIRLKVENLERVALMKFFNGEDLDPVFDEPTFTVLCYRIFQRKSELGGIPQTTDEMSDPTWFHISRIPWNIAGEMKPGDEVFVPKILSGELTKGYVHFSKDAKQVYSSTTTPCLIEDLVI